MEAQFNYQFLFFVESLLCVFVGKDEQNANKDWTEIEGCTKHLCNVNYL